jgi:antitoxin ParD1/3/4
MAGVEKLTIALTPEMRAMVNEAVEGGDYASTSEVIREALRDWREKRERKQKAIEELRRMVEEGLASGPARERDIKDIIAEARRRRANNS